MEAIVCESTMTRAMCKRFVFFHNEENNDTAGLLVVGDLV